MTKNRVQSLFFMICALFICLSAHAQKYRYQVNGLVQDAITGEGMPVKLYLMTADSIVIDSVSTEAEQDPESGKAIYTGEYSFPGVIEKGHYIVHAVSEGYQDAYMNCELKSKREFYIPVRTIYMYKVHKLKEVTVKATKLKMVIKKDTIVYNADAFNLPEGSMLETLVARLPGAKLTKDGQIYVNGKYVESLLVNGNNFFSGNPMMALENLPAYTVSKIKVFNKAGQKSQMMGQDMGDKVYTMDVRLKKEYATGYMGNFEAGAGTQHRYMTRAFLMKFSDKERIGTYFNMNNLNDNQRARLDGEWSPQDVSDGLTTTKTAGLSYMRPLSTPISWFQSDVTWEHTNDNLVTKTNTQTFLPDGDSYRKAVSNMRNSSTSWQTTNLLILQEDAYYVTSNLAASYKKKTGWGLDNQRDSVHNSLLSRLMESQSNDVKHYGFTFDNSVGWKVLMSDMFGVTGQVYYTRDLSRSLLSSDLQYPTAALPADKRVRYLNTPNQNLKLTAGLHYIWNYRGRSVIPEYKYIYNFNKTNNLLYRLDRIGAGPYSLDNLPPSTALMMAGALDGNNTYEYRERRHEHLFNLSYSSLKSLLFGAEFRVGVPIRLLHASLNYERMGMQHISRQRTFFEPMLSLEKQGQWSVRMGMSSDFPEMTLLTTYRDDSNPLYVREGNSKLRDIHKYYVTGNVTFRGQHQQSISLSASYNQTDNAVAYGLQYDKTTSVSHILPVSVNGNWHINGSFNFTRALDKNNRLTIDNNFAAEYRHSVDMAQTLGSTGNERSIVGNVILDNTLKLNYRANDNAEVALHGGVKYYSITSKRTGFEAIHAGDYNVGLNTTLALPCHFQLVTDITVFMRRGYQQAEMNTSDWLWNAQLTRSFFNNHLLAKLQAFDILHQLRSTSYAVNEQGRVETWHNSIPRYVMFSLAWKFNVNPKKK